MITKRGDKWDEATTGTIHRLAGKKVQQFMDDNHLEYDLLDDTRALQKQVITDALITRLIIDREQEDAVSSQQRNGLQEMKAVLRENLRENLRAISVHDDDERSAMARSSGWGADYVLDMKWDMKPTKEHLMEELGEDYADRLSSLNVQQPDEKKFVAVSEVVENARTRAREV